MDKQIDQLTVKKYFRHILDKNQSFLSAAVQQRRLIEIGNRVENKMELINIELTQLAQLINEFKTLEKTVKGNPTKIIPSQTNLADIAQRQLFQEIDRLEKMYTLLSKKTSADPKQLDRIATRIDAAKKRINKDKNPQLS